MVALEIATEGCGVMKRWPWIAFVLGCALQWAAPLMQIITYEQVLTSGELHRFKCAAPDPYDMFRGRYLAVRVQPDTVNVPKGESFAHGEPVHALLEAGGDGFAIVKALARKRPADGAFVTVTVDYVHDGTAHISWPFDRFYLNERIAPKADEWFRANWRGAEPVIAEVRVLDGRAVLADLEHRGQSFREVLKGMDEAR